MPPTESMPQDDYVKNPNRCPACRSTDIEGGFVDVDGATATQRVRCHECEAEWTDTYHLSGYGDLETT